MAGQVDLVRQDVNDPTEVHPPVLLTNFSCVGVSEHGVSDQFAMDLAKALQPAADGTSPVPSIDGLLRDRVQLMLSKNRIKYHRQ